MKTSIAKNICTTITKSVAIATLAVVGLSGCASGPEYSDSRNSQQVYGSHDYYGRETGARAGYAPGNDPYYSRYEYYPSRQSGYYPPVGSTYFYGDDYRR